jgi:hypothetical protein
MHISTSTKRATIGLYAGRNLQNVEAIQTNANQFEEGTANMTYQSGLLHIVPLEQFQGGQAQPYYGQGYYRQDINNNHHKNEQEVKNKNTCTFGLIFIFIYFQMGVQTCVCSVFYFIYF